MTLVKVQTSAKATHPLYVVATMVLDAKFLQLPLICSGKNFS